MVAEQRCHGEQRFYWLDEEVEWLLRATIEYETTKKKRSIQSPPNSLISFVSQDFIFERKTPNSTFKFLGCFSVVCLL